MKKLLSLFLCVLFLCTFAATSAFADNSTSTKVEPYIEARYSDFSMIYANLHENDYGFYNISGGAGAYSNQKWIEVTVTLEACHPDGKYYPVDDFEWTAANYATASTIATRDLPGGSYRTHTHAVCSLNGTVLEEEDAYSNVVYVPY